MPAHVREAAEAFLQLIADDQSSEVLANGPNEIIAKSRGQRFHLPKIQFGDVDAYHHVINTYLLPYTDTADRVDGKTVLIEGQLTMPSGEQGVPPMLARVHILAPPMVEAAKITIAKKERYELSLDEMQQKGSMTEAMAHTLKAFSRGKLCIVVSGVSGAGKTTLLQAMAHFWDNNDRVICVEDTPELTLPLADVVYLTASTRRPGDDIAKLVTLEFCVQAANRMRPSRIIVGEVRGGEMAEWLVAANSGADGSMVTIHADNSRRALDKMLTLASKNPTSGTESTLRKEIANTVQIIVQAALIENGRHVITEITEVSTVVSEKGVTGLTPLFEYDRSRGRHVALNPPSDNLRRTLAERGVPLDLALFR